MKDDIILNSRAHSFQAGEQLHARSVHSIFPKHQLKCKMRPLSTNGNKKKTQLGRQAGKSATQGLGNKDTPSKKGKQEGRQALRQEGDKADKALGMRTRHPTKGNKKGEKLGDNRGDKLRNKL